jgi:hypothetical protein
MYVQMTAPLFDWKTLEDRPSLRTVEQLLAMIPDGKLVESLRAARGRGRDDYPIAVLLGVVYLTTILRHPTFEACLAELTRNAGLRGLIGIDSEAQVPKAYNVSRFLDVLGREPHRTLLHEVFDTMAHRLGVVVEDLGRDAAGDSTTLNGRAKADARAVRAEVRDDLAQPSGGRKEYTDDSGAVTKVFEWFGYKLHLVVDVRHEVALAYEVTSTKGDDGQMLPAVLAQAQANLPEGRMRTLAYDKAADSEAAHQALADAGVKPVIENRSLWKDELERTLPCQHDNIVYDESGTVYCYDMTSSPAVKHRMSYIGHEPRRGTLKYRCPAKHERWRCPHGRVCNQGRRYGLTVRVKQEIDLRRFPPIPRATKQFERRYKGRTAVERVNARVKVFWGADDGNIRGATRFNAFIGVVMVVHLAFATALAATPRRFGPLGQMRLGPVQKALQQGLHPR